MQRSRAPFEVPDIYSHTAATVPSPTLLCDGGWVSAFQQEHLEDQTQTIQQCKRYWLEVPDLCGSFYHLR